MATCTAVQTGNWSSAGTWDTPPSTGDTVELGGYNVTADADINIGTGTIQNTAGGTLVIPESATRSITANLNQIGNSQILTVATGTTVNWTGDMANSYGGKVAAYAFSGILNVTGNVSNSGGDGARACEARGTAAEVNVTGNVSNSGNGSARGAFGNSGGLVTISGILSNTNAAGVAGELVNGYGGMITAGSISASSAGGIIINAAATLGSGLVVCAGAYAGNVLISSGYLEIGGDATFGTCEIKRGAVLATLGAFTASSFTNTRAVWLHRSDVELPASPGTHYNLPIPADVRKTAIEYFGGHTGEYESIGSIFGGGILRG